MEPPKNDNARLRELLQQAVTKYDGLQDYIVRFRRREFANGKNQPEDLIEFKYRRQPEAIYFKWLGGPLEGRELIFVPGQFNNQMQIKTGKGDPLPNLRVGLDVHSARATANTRRTVDEAPIGTLIDRFGAAVVAQEAGAPNFGTLRYLGPQQRPESPVPMTCVVQHLPPKLEKDLPRGGTRFWYFNEDSNAQESKLPVLVITYDEKEKEVEYYCFDRMIANVGLGAESFDPNLVWAKR